MPLQDILTAITAQTDQKITTARAAHKNELSKLRGESERRISTCKQEILRQKEARKKQRRAKAQAHAEAIRRHATLRKKQTLLDRLYERVLGDFAALPDGKAEPVLRSLLKGITEKGTMHPAAKHEQLLRKLAPSEQFTIGNATAAKGGFLFVSETREENCTFEHLITETVRPRTELEASKVLFTQ